MTYLAVNDSLTADRTFTTEIDSQPYLFMSDTI